MASASGSADAAGEPVSTGSKWRPRIGLVVLAILLTVMALPLVGLFFFRIYENQLVRQTEAELIGQGAAIAAIYAREVRDAGAAARKARRRGCRRTRPQRQQRRRADDRYRPIEPSLDLAVDATLGPRPDPLPATPDPAFAAIGARLVERARRHATDHAGRLQAARPRRHGDRRRRAMSAARSPRWRRCAPHLPAAMPACCASA